MLCNSLCHIFLISILDQTGYYSGIPARRMEHTLKSTWRIQVGITPLIIFILDPLHVDFTVKRRSLIHRRSKPS
ncbi:Uncharacterised protein [Salmonella enterica subsp. enterica serovar Bovismorbificans]|uniref:Uncharacterized protein n=1 Tax=Salmonella enterica subsp. enterica serovar Bovismorbificans TaxID=58097 RepID=A0A655BQK5_SALET|nr:Uncharacterised protein [Salmonella enterica subsp. enterica serovar Bovismorbificans]